MAKEGSRKYNLSNFLLLLESTKAWNLGSLATLSSWTREASSHGLSTPCLLQENLYFTFCCSLESPGGPLDCDHAYNTGFSWLIKLHHLILPTIMRYYHYSIHTQVNWGLVTLGNFLHITSVLGLRFEHGFNCRTGSPNLPPASKSWLLQAYCMEPLISIQKQGPSTLGNNDLVLCSQAPKQILISEKPIIKWGKIKIIHWVSPKSKLFQS